MNVVVQPVARRDLEEITDYLAQQNLQAAIRFTLKAGETFDKLLFMPGLGSLLEMAHPALRGVRLGRFKGSRTI